MKKLLLAGAIAVSFSATSTRAPAPRVQRLDGAWVDAFEAPAAAKAIVFIFTSTDCPISNRYAPEIRRIVDTFAPKGVTFRLVYPNPSDQPPAIREHMSAFGYAGAIDAFRDPQRSLVKRVSATVTPEAVIAVRGNVKYRGRIDDRYVELGRERPAATKHDLADALDAVLAGRGVSPSTTQAVGCFIADFGR